MHMASEKDLCATLRIARGMTHGIGNERLVATTGMAMATVIQSRHFGDFGTIERV